MTEDTDCLFPSLLLHNLLILFTLINDDDVLLLPLGATAAFEISSEFIESIENRLDGV